MICFAAQVKSERVANAQVQTIVARGTVNAGVQVEAVRAVSSGVQVEAVQLINAAVQAEPTSPSVQSAGIGAQRTPSPRRAVHATAAAAAERRSRAVSRAASVTYSEEGFEDVGGDVASGGSSGDTPGGWAGQRFGARLTIPHHGFTRDGCN